MALTSWREKLEKERVAEGDDTPIVHCTLSDEGLDRVFDTSRRGTQGEPFTAWSERRVYFPAQYDGSEWVASVPRDPCDEDTGHVGDG